jgi:hypothetical protein
MAKLAPTAVLDAPLDAIAAATELYYCNGQPSNRADAITRQSAPAITMAGGDFVKSSSGGNRLLTIAAKSTTATVSQATDHVVLCSGSAILLITTCPSQTTNSGSTVGSASFVVTSPAIV